jgi:hypothetical protein
MNMTLSYADPRSVTKLASALVACLAFAHSGQALAFKGCEDRVQLKSATGVVGQKHHYVVSGTCSVRPSQNASGTVDFSYIGTAEWDRKTGAAKETLKLSGGLSLVRLVTAVCTNDPFLKSAPGGTASCSKVTAQADDIAPGVKIYPFILEKQFVASRQLDLALAQALSAEHAQKQSQPPAKAPPPAKPKPETPKVKAGGAAGAPAAATPSAAAQSAAKAFNIEAELLTAPGKFQVNGGRVVMQPMASFGPGWSGSRQLFWSGGATGAVLDLLVDIPASGTYAVELYLTRAPDYANLKIEVDGKSSTANFVGYAAKVTAPVPLQAGKFPLQAGQRRIAFMIVGKQQQSSNYFVGIDRIRLYPAGAQ